MFTIIRDESNRIAHFKARLVVKDLSQCKGESYNEVLSLVVNFTIIRLFFTIFVTYFKWEHWQFDIKNA